MDGVVRSPPFCRPWWEGGGDDTRGVQKSFPQAEPDAMESAAAEGAASRLPRLRGEEAAAALRTATGRGSTVPVHRPDTAMPLVWEVQESGAVGSLERVGQSLGKDSQGGLIEALSQRREFLCEDADGVSLAVLMEGLWVSTCRGQKGRQVGEGSGFRGQRPVTVIRSPRLGTREMAGMADEMMRMGPPGTVSARFPTLAARRYYGPESPAGRRGSRRHRGQRGHRGRRKRGWHNKEGHGLSESRDNGQGDMDGAPRAGCQNLLSCSDTDSVLRMEGAVRGEMAASRMAVDGRDRAVGPSAPADPPPRSASRRSLPGLAERWGTRETKTAPATSECLVNGPRKDARILPVGDDDAPRTGGEASSGSGKAMGQSEYLSIPDYIEARLASGGGQLSLEIRREDWSRMQEVGLGTHPDLAVAFAWRRSSGPSTGRDHKPLPTIQLVSHEAVDIPKGSWPTSWKGLVEHVETGGYFRKVGAIRGGMDPAVAQQLRLVDFNQHLDWNEIDRNLARVRAGEMIPQDQLTETMLLAQQLSGCTALQQWDPLAAFLAAQPEEVRRGLIISPARLAALAVVAARPRQEQTAPPEWLLNASFAELRFHHLSPSDFVPDPHRANDLRGQIQDGIVNRLLCVAPEITQHPHYRLQDLRSDMRVELNLKDPQVETCLFSAILVLPNGPWLSDFYRGARSLGERSFCTIAPTDLHVETELLNTDQQVLRAIRSALGVDHAAFRLMLDETLSRALRCDVRSRDDTVRFTSTGGRGGKRTMEHVTPESPDSRLLTTMDATSLILARRTVNSLPLRLGPVTVSITLMQCPQQALRNALQPREPAAIRLRQPGTVIGCPVVLMGPLPKGSIPAWTVKSGARMAELRRDMNAVCRAELQTKDVQLVGRYDKDRSPMFLYMEFGSAEAANAFGLQGDQMVPPEFGRLLASLWGEKAFQTPFWSCNLLAECLAVADEKALKALMSHGQAHACPLPPPALPPPPLPPPLPGAGQVADGSGSAASGPDKDNPANAQH